MAALSWLPDRGLSDRIRTQLSTPGLTSVNPGVDNWVMETQREPDVGAVQTAVDDPAAFLRMAWGERGEDQSWMEPYGGPIGVAALIPILQEALSEQSHRLAQVRADVINTELETRSLADVGRELGISRNAVHKAARVTAYIPDLKLRPGGMAELLQAHTIAEIGRMK